MTPPPPKPWMARPAIKILIELETALMIDPIKNVAMANKKTAFLPKISENYEASQYMFSV